MTNPSSERSALPQFPIGTLSQSGFESSLPTLATCLYVMSKPKAICSDKKISGFGEFVEPIFSQMANMILKNQNLRNSRDLLLPKLITGEIDVSELNIDIERKDSHASD